MPELGYKKVLEKDMLLLYNLIITEKYVVKVIPGMFDTLTLFEPTV